jgi:hypothetical protein
MMIAIDSRTAIIIARYESPRYITSEPHDSEWGQPAASHYEFTVVDNTLYGQPIGMVYAPSPSSDILPVDPYLATELEAWDAASDEALVNFEATLD